MQPTPSSDTRQPGLNADAKRAIELSVREANRLQHRYLGTEHLLLGVVSQREGLAAELLRKRRISDVNELRQHILRRINEGPTVATKPLTVKGRDLR
jgi:ATP-dependent Clp protease ATP-binding subunit ClpC